MASQLSIGGCTVSGDEESKNEIAELRKDVQDLYRLLKMEMRRREVIERYLDSLTSSIYMSEREKWANRTCPIWGWFHALRVLYREPYYIWARDEFDKLLEERRMQERQGVDTGN